MVILKDGTVFQTPNMDGPEMRYEINYKGDKKMFTKPIIAVYDKKVGMFDNPFVVRHIGDAVREWSIVKTDEKNKYGKHPADFDLFQIGEYNEATGELKNITHVHLDSGV